MRALAMLVSLVPAVACAATLVVAPSGGDFTGVQAALDAAQPGDVVRVRTGVYHEKVAFPRSGTSGNPIVLEAWPGDAPVLDGTGVAGEDMVLLEDRSWITVRGLEIRNDSGVTDGAGIRLMGAGTNVELRDNDIHTIHGRNAVGITVYATRPTPVTALVIDGNHIHDCEPAPSEALTVNGNVDGFAITNNLVEDVNNIGIVAIGGERDIQPDQSLVARNGAIARNVVRRARSVYGGGFAGGIYVDGGRDLVVERNVVTGSDIGMEIGAENNGIVARNVVVRENVLFLNEKAGLAFGGFSAGAGRVADSAIHHNTTWHNDTLGAGYGELWIQYASNVTVSDNVFVAGSAGLLLASYGGNAANVLDWNLWSTDGPPTWIWNNDELAGLAAYQAATGQDAHALSADPQLAAPATGDVHLGAGSPAIDAGDPAFTADAGETDVDGAPRIIGPRVDRGADEASRCGDGVVQPPEECDDGNATSGDGCDANCTTTRCGNGVVTAGEQCDDGNTTSGDCCSATCTLEGAGSACDDANPCTGPDACNGSGACVGLVQPQPGCRAAASTLLILKNGTPDTKDGLTWKWTKGAATAAGDFGTPLVPGAAWTLCVYDTTSGTPSRALRATIPTAGVCAARPCWKALGTSGFRYADRSTANDGLSGIVARAGADGRASIVLKGKGGLLDMPPLPLAQSPVVTVQLHAAGGACFASTHTAPAQRNDGTQFRDGHD